MPTKPQPTKPQKRSFQQAVLIVTAIVVIVFGAIPSPFYDFTAKTLSNVNLAIVSFGLLAVAACFVDIKTNQVRLQPPNWKVIWRALTLLIAVLVAALTINAKVRFRLSTIQNERFATRLQTLDTAVWEYQSLSTRKDECYGTLYKKILHGGDCKCP